MYLSGIVENENINSTVFISIIASTLFDFENQASLSLSKGFAHFT